jgi:phage terminase large subunit-like protein
MIKASKGKIFQHRDNIKKSNLKDIEAIKWEDIEKELKIEDYSSLTEVELEKLVKIKADCERRREEYGILYYEPQVKKHDGKEEYQEAFHKDGHKIRLILGGNQTGKTEAAVAEGIWITLGIHPYKKIDIPNKGRVIAADLDKGIEEVIHTKYKKLMPPSEIRKISKYSGGQLKKIYLKNGSTIEFLSYEQDVKVFEGWTGNWVQFDEPPPRSIFVATMRGLMRYAGIAWLALTPLSEPWIYDDLYLPGMKNDEKINIYNWDILDNKYLTKEEVEDFEKRLNSDEKAARLRGKFKHLSGLIYKKFGKEHIIKSFKIPSDWTRYCAMDYHSRVPCAILWAAVDPEGTVYFYDELWIDKNIPEISEAIASKEEENGVSRIRLIDSLSATPDRITGRSPQREFLRCGQELGHSLAFRSSDKSWNVGKNTVDEYLTIINDKAGAYFFEDKVSNCITGMTHYQWDEYAGTRNYGIKKETPAKAFSHFPDCVRYILITRPSYQREIVQNEEEDNFHENNFKMNPLTGYRG